MILKIYFRKITSQYKLAAAKTAPAVSAVILEAPLLTQLIATDIPAMFMLISAAARD